MHEVTLTQECERTVDANAHHASEALQACARDNMQANRSKTQTTESVQTKQSPPRREEDLGLPFVTLVDNGNGPELSTGYDPKANWLQSAATRALRVGEAAVSGAYNEVARGATSLYEHPEQVGQAIASAGDAIGDAASGAYRATANFTQRAIDHPGQTAEESGAAIWRGVQATGGAIAGLGEWAYDHPIQSVAMLGAAGLTVGTMGTSSPLFLLTGAGAGAAATVHGGFAIGETLNNDGPQIDILSDPSRHTEAEVAAARQRLEADLVTPLLATAAGLLGGRLLAGGARAVFGGAEGGAVEASTAAETAPSSAARTAAGSAETAPPGTPRTHEQNALPSSSSTPATTSDAPSQAQNATPQRTDGPAPIADTPPSRNDRQTTTPDATSPTDASGRPISERNEERIENEHKPLTPLQLAEQERALAQDLERYNGGNGQSIYQRFLNSNLTTAERGRVMSVAAEVRAGLCGADGQILPTQLDNYRHMLGEMNEGLESAASRQMSSRRTQDALLAGLLSDSHKFGFSRLDGGNFFTHHLDGALAARTILSRHLGDGFTTEDINAVSHAILEHQIGPPGFMSNAYAAEIRRGMAQAGVTATEEDAARIEHIRALMSDPMRAPVEHDQMGGYRIAFSPEERALLNRYVGAGTENWHVPNSQNSWDDVSRTMIAADSFDNYYSRIDPNGAVETAPFKIAALRGPASTPADLTLGDAERALHDNETSALSLLSGPDRERALARMQDSDEVFRRAREATRQWLREELGHEPDDTTPYWGHPIPPKPPWSAPQEMASWQQNPDVQLAFRIQQHYAQVLHDMRLMQQ